MIEITQSRSKAVFIYLQNDKLNILKDAAIPKGLQICYLPKIRQFIPPIENPILQKYKLPKVKYNISFIVGLAGPTKPYLLQAIFSPRT